ncbi:MAG: serine/threonine protein phosphatase [Clostridia bacterium]|jgi:predicted phosphohydrolase|nr:serine/threonine protein phosphatase [Clostridia bacterium]
MSIFVIADLHLSFKNPKPMNIFGENWKEHEIKIEKSWQEKVKRDDLVIIPGDFSWAMSLEDAYLDFRYIDNLPGKKLLLKGNHDYWWTTLTKMRNYIKEKEFNKIDFIYNNSYCFENYIITGTRGWTLNAIEDNTKILNRELGRLEISLQEGIQKFGKEKEIIVFMHYPPITNSAILNKSELKFVELMKQYNVKKCMYGHLHSNSHKDAIEGMREDINFKLVSADYLKFELMEII